MVIGHIDRVEAIMGFSFKTMYGYFAGRKKTDAVWYKTMYDILQGEKRLIILKR